MAMIKMVYSTGDLLLSRLTRVPAPRPQIPADARVPSDLSTTHGLPDSIPDGYLELCAKQRDNKGVSSTN